MEVILLHVNTLCLLYVVPTSPAQLQARNLLFDSVGVALISHLLQHSSPKHQSVELLNALESFADAVRASETLHRDIHLRLLLNLELFSHAGLETQRHLVHHLGRLSRVCFPKAPTILHKAVRIALTADLHTPCYWGLNKKILDTLLET